MKIINIILLILINFVIVKFLLNRKYSNLGYSIIPISIFIILNLYVRELPINLILFILFFSFGLIILSFMNSIMDVMRNNNSNISEEVKSIFTEIKYYIANIVMPIGITFFQIVIMLNKEMWNTF